MRLNLGCGEKHREGYVNIDIAPPADIVCNIATGLPFEDASVSEVYSEAFLEHIPQERVIFVMNDIWRVLEPDGKATHVYATAGYEQFWKDPTHLSHWVQRTFNYFTPGTPEWEHHRQYGITSPIKVLSFEMNEGGTGFITYQKSHEPA